MLPNLAEKDHFKFSTWAPAKNKKIKIAIAIVCKRLLIGVLKTDA